VLFYFSLLVFVTSEKHKCDRYGLFRTIFNDKEEIIIWDFFIFFKYFVGGLFFNLFDRDLLSLTPFDYFFFIEYKCLMVIMRYEYIASAFKHIIKIIVRIKTIIYFYFEVRQVPNHISVKSDK